MKIALLLHGFAQSKLAYKPQPFRGWNYQADALVDYRNSLKNYKDTIFECSNTDVYFHTWKTDLLNTTKILSDLKPINHSITDPSVQEFVTDKNRRTSSRQQSILKSLQVFNESDQSGYDFIIVTRFDLHFHFNVPKLISGQTLAPSDLLISFWIHKPSLTDDNFYALHPSKIIDFQEMVRSTKVNLKSSGLHHMHKKCEYGKVKAIFGGSGLNVNVKNPLYHIVRNISRRGKGKYKFLYSKDNKRALNCKYCRD